MDEHLIKFMVENDSRITYEDRWLMIESGVNGYNFVVYQKPHRAKITRIIKSTKYLESALATLKSGVT